MAKSVAVGLTCESCVQHWPEHQGRRNENNSQRGFRSPRTHWSQKKAVSRRWPIVHSIRSRDNSSRSCPPAILSNTWKLPAQLSETTMPPTGSPHVLLFFRATRPPELTRLR